MRSLLPAVPLWLVACAGGPCAAPPPPAPPVSAPSPAAAPAAPSPDWTVLGLPLGRARHADIEDWAARLALPGCVGAPVRTRQAWQLQCRGTLPLGPLAPRVVGGRWTELLVARPDDGPAHHLSMVRTHSLPGSARADYESTLTHLVASLGPPTVRQDISDSATLDASPLRWGSRWATDGGEVTLTLSRFGPATSPLLVTEVWALDVPSARAERPEGRAPNPHLTPAPAPSSADAASAEAPEGAR